MLNLFQGPLNFLARYGRLVLVAGLLAGIFLPDLALFLREWLPEMVTLLLFLAAFRIGPRQAIGSLSDIRAVLAYSVTFQMIIPCLLVLVLIGFGISGPFALAIVLMASGSTISGSPNLTILTGNDPAAALRILVVGTALLPLTVTPVFWLEPAVGSAAEVAEASGRLLLVIAASGGIGFLTRHFLLPNPTAENLSSVDGASALVMAVLVIGLMSAVGPALSGDPQILLAALALVFAVNFGFQFLTHSAMKGRLNDTELPAFSICAGNRNMALFLVALPRELTDPLLLFIGCYQIPMYLTPILLGWLYRKKMAQE